MFNNFTHTLFQYVCGVKTVSVGVDERQRPKTKIKHALFATEKIFEAYQKDDRDANLTRYR